jgi:hypothetical protein
MRTRFTHPTFGDFRCAHCQAVISSLHMVSGVNNRNHCPYCLWSLHLDLYSAGDRLSACKAPMQPIGLTMKRSRNKYRYDTGGELMLIHQCIECQTLSINRIAADDDAATIMNVFYQSVDSVALSEMLYQKHGIVLLQREDLQVVSGQLYGLLAGAP